MSIKTTTWNVFYHTRGQNMDRIHVILLALGSFVVFSNSGSTKINCPFDVDVLSAGFSLRVAAVFRRRRF